MSHSIILMAETGSDVTPELAKELGVLLVPMHVSMGDQTLDDGTFPPEEVCAYYDRTGTAPTTSGSTPKAKATAFFMMAFSGGTTEAKIAPVMRVRSTP